VDLNKEYDSKRLRELRANILKACFYSKEGHIPSAFSILDILYCLYILLPKNSSINLKDKDFFILSKGHASLALYAILEEAKVIDGAWQTSFCDFNSRYGGHPDMKKISGVHASTGSLGHGLPITVGKVLARRVLGVDSKAFCLIGDGELNEGSIWESLLLASHHKMSELTVIVDNNASSDRALELHSLKSKFDAFGFNVKEVNGHSHCEILEAIQLSDSNKPSAIIAQTIKGFGIRDFEGNPAWHHAVPTKTQLENYLKALN
jgi:transketolase